MPPRVLVMGPSSRVAQHFLGHPPKGWEVETAGRTAPSLPDPSIAHHTPLDPSDEDAVRQFLRGCTATAWLNFVARTDVDGCESERPAAGTSVEGPGAPGSAWRLNAELPRWLAEEAERGGRFLVHLSTDFVFAGDRGPYPEATPPDPLGPQVSWYGYTKGVGEAAVFRSKAARAIVRISYPYGSGAAGKSDLALTLLTRRREGTLYPLYADQRITPTWVPDVSEAIAPILERSAARVYHVASPEVTTPLKFARALLTAGGWPIDGLRSSRLAEETSRPGRAPRPLRGGLLVSQVHKLDVRPRSFREGIRLLFDGREAAPVAATAGAGAPR